MFIQMSTMNSNLEVVILTKGRLVSVMPLI
jgi:hypothetical protein